MEAKNVETERMKTLEVLGGWYIRSTCSKGHSRKLQGRKFKNGRKRSRKNKKKESESFDELFKKSFQMILKKDREGMCY